MDREIQVFKNLEFGQIRTMVMPDGQVGFVGEGVVIGQPFLTHFLHHSVKTL